MSDATDAIEANLAKPKKLEGDGAKVEQHSLQDQIKAAEFIDGATALDKPPMGLRFTRLKRPGTP